MCSLVSFTKYIRLLFMSICFCVAAYAQNDTVSVAKKESKTVFNTINPLLVVPVKERHIADTILNRIKNDDAFWYLNTTPRNPKTVTSSGSGWWWLLQQSWFRWLIWLIIIGGFTSVLIWYISTSNVKLFHKEPGAVKNNEDQSFSVDIFSLEYDTAIPAAIHNQNYRLAVRYLFLQTLKIMAENKMIQYKADRTDSEYVQQLLHTVYYTDFYQLTRNFEYIWYGQMEIPASSFYTIKNAFELFKKRLSH
jgi:hypothetical protein